MRMLSDWFKFYPELIMIFFKKCISFQFECKNVEKPLESIVITVDDL